MIKLNILAIQELLQFALLHFAFKKLLHFVLVLHFAAIVITFWVSITFCRDYYVLRRNNAVYRLQIPALVQEIFKFEKCVKYANEMTDDVIHAT